MGCCIDNENLRGRRNAVHLDTTAHNLYIDGQVTGFYTSERKKKLIMHKNTVSRKKTARYSCNLSDLPRACKSLHCCSRTHP
eukprot:750256-Hanusia_phi.AAC.3